MRLNPEKCVFRVLAEKFLGFMLTARGIEVNPKTCITIIDMRSPKNLKEIQRLIGRFTSLARFLPRLTEWIKLILKMMKKQTTDKWDEQCENAFQEIKAMIVSPPLCVDRSPISLCSYTYRCRMTSLVHHWYKKTQTNDHCTSSTGCCRTWRQGTNL